jgi:hypothetical protein
MTKRNWLVTVVVSLLLAISIGPAAHAGFFTYHHCPKSSYCPLNYWTPNLVTGVALLKHNPPYLYAIDRNVGVPYGYIYCRFPCPETYPQTLYSFPQLDQPKPPKPTESQEPK